MKVLIIHNAYQCWGGEDAVVANESALLRNKGVDVRLHLVANRSLDGFIATLIAAINAIFSVPQFYKVGRILKTWRPDVVHMHNLFPLVTPSVIYACRKAGVPVVCTLHNYRILCPTSLLMFDGSVTERSLSEGPWWAVRKRVYRGSFLGTFVLATLISVHKAAGTWSDCVTRFVSLTRFASMKFSEGGLPVSRIRIKPNFVDLPAPAEGNRQGFLFVGRLSPEKGVEVLGAALELLSKSAESLRVIGDGPAAKALAGKPSVTMMGALPPYSVYYEMVGARALVMPSIWYEGFPMVLVEAYACGLPVIASRLGALAELVDDGVTGLLFDPGSPEDLADKLRWAGQHPGELARMGRAARARYEAYYTPETNFAQLMSIYEEAITENRRGSLHG